jgi:tetratricopeptide (TPR) repeat protein
MVLPSPSAIAASQRARVGAMATDIRSFRLNEEHLRKLTLVTQAMERLPQRGPEAPRSDVALFTILSMSLSFNEPLTEQTVPGAVRMIQGGHPELATAIKAADLSFTDYVLTQITLLLAYPVIAAERQGRSAGVTDDVSPANLAFVRANWSRIEKALKALADAAVAPPNLEDVVGVFQRTGLEPAARALAVKDVSGAKRLVTDVTRAFQALPPVLQTGQATSVQRVARGYMDMRLYDEAFALLELSARALEGAGPAGDQSLALVLADMARARRLSSRPGDAEALINRAQALRGPTAVADPDAYPIRVEMAELRRERGDLIGADGLLRPLIAAADQMNGWQYMPNLARLFEAYAALLNQRGESNLARTFLARAETIKRNMAAAEKQMRRLQQHPAMF